jgi:anti-sigma factor RsiW
MVVTCEQVWQEISNYLESDLDPSLRTALDEHFQICPRCASMLAGTRNVVQLYGDERLFQLPVGFSGRLQKKLAHEMPARRGTIYGWVVAAAAVALIGGGIALSRPKPSSPFEVRSPLAKPGKHVPANLTVLVAGDSKIFHVAGCDLLRAQDGRIRSMSAEQAEHEGYVPCIRCLGKYLSSITLDFLKRHFSGVLA